jgi:hypothetical protein
VLVASAPTTRSAMMIRLTLSICSHPASVPRNEWTPGQHNPQGCIWAGAQPSDRLQRMTSNLRSGITPIHPGEASSTSLSDVWSFGGDGRIGAPGTCSQRLLRRRPAPGGGGHSVEYESTGQAQKVRTAVSGFSRPTEEQDGGPRLTIAGRVQRSPYPHARRPSNAKGERLPVADKARPSNLNTATFDPPGRCGLPRTARG